jgi:conjugal transfer pilus assembly protein TraU
MKEIIKLLILSSIFSLFLLTSVNAKCEGSFVNPITDVCWDCFFPISIGSMNIASSEYPDTDNPSTPIEVCKMEGPPYMRVGLNIGFWEPFALTDVTPEPYCMVNLGGFTMDIGNAGRGGKQVRDPVDSGSFYYVHWYKYPLMLWLNIITAVGCFQGGDFDIAYLTELDPTWNDDELAFVLNPEAILFGNPVAQAACAADAINAQIGLPIDKLFWCAGTQGSMYPFTGRVSDEKGPIQSAVLLSERMDFKLHRQLMIEDSSPDSGGGFEGPICHQHFAPIMSKSRYRYQMTNTIAKADKCYQFGHDVITWEAGHNKPDSADAFGFLIWKKRNCTFL